MKIKRRSWKERILAFALALILVLSGVIPDSILVSNAAETGSGETDAPGSGESEPNAPIPATVSVTFSVQNESGAPISDAAIIVTDENSQELTATDGAYTVDSGKTYNYSVSKAGYETVADSFTASDSMSPITVTLLLGQIELSDIPVGDFHPGDKKTVSIRNADSNLTYTWATSDSNVAEISQTSGASVEVTAQAEGTATLTVTCSNGVSKEIPVTVSKINTAIFLTANPAGSAGDAVSQVELAVTGLPDDATGSLEFYVNGIKQHIIADITTGKAWTYASADIIGNMTFKAVYVGDARYNGSASTEVAASYKRNQPLEINDADYHNSGEKKIIREDVDDAEKKFQIPLKSDSTGRTLTYSSSNVNVATVSNTGEIQILAPGKTTITVVAAENAKYTRAEVDYVLIVQKVIDFSKNPVDITWEEFSKIYDGEKEVSLTGNLPQVEGGPSGVKAVFKALVDAPEASVQKKNAKISGTAPLSFTSDDANFTEEDLRKLYVLENCDQYSVSGKVTIDYRNVYVDYIKTKNAELVYGQNLSDAVSKLNIDEYMTIRSASGSGDDGLIPADQEFKPSSFNQILYDSEQLHMVLDTSVPEKQAECTIYENVLKTNIPAAGLIAGSYRLLDGGVYGNLTVAQEKLSLEDILSRISINNTISGIKQDGEKIYVRGDNTDVLNNSGHASASLSAQITGDAADYYNSVKFKFSDGVGEHTVDLTAGYVFGGASRAITGQIYLESPKGVTNVIDSARNLTIYVDSDSPKVTFGNWKESNRILDDFASTITFGHYQSKSNYTLGGVEKEDLPAENGSGATIGSEEAAWSYYILRRSPDENGNYAEITAQDVKDAVSDTGWTAINEDGPASIPVVVSASGNLDDIADYYVVLVKVVDEVGNAAVYASNGLVVDVVEPSVEITDGDGNSFVDGFIYQTEEVPYNVVITDYAAAGIAASGIEKYTLRITSNGKGPAPEETYIAAVDKTYTIEQLQNQLVTTIKNAVNSAENNSNDVNIQVVAYDQSGIKREVNQPLMIDLTNPEINVSFNNNDVRNGKYFNADRVMTIEFTERNFDREKVTFDVQASADLSKAAIDKDIKVSGLAQYGIKAEWVSDSQEGVDIKNYTDGRVNTLRLTFSADNEYYIVPHCVDNAGRKNNGVNYAKGSQAADTFVIDKTAPEIQVNYISDKEISADVNQRTYTQQNVTALVKITEKNFYEEKNFVENQMAVNVTGTEAPEGIEDYQTLANTGWSQQVNEYSHSFEFAKDANYSFGLTYTDLAGNEATYAPHYFTVDDTVPTGSIAVGEKKWDAFWNKVTFGIFKDITVEAKLSSDDVTAGVKSMQYYVFTPDKESRGEFEALTIEDLKHVSWTDGSSVSISPNSQGLVYMKVVDKADNVTYINAKEGIIADNKKPTGPQITITVADPPQGIYNGDVPFNISVTETEEGGTYSGLADVQYAIISNGVTTQQRSYAPELSDRTARIWSFSRDVVVDAEQNNTNDVQIVVKAKDNAGNWSEATKDLKIDTTKPKVSIEYDLNSPSNGKYYNQVRTATVTVLERNFDPNQVDFTITNTDGTMPTISGWTVDSSGATDDAVNTCTVTFAADGDYTITMNCTDRAGNRSEYTRVDEFTIDRTVPVINVSFDNNSSRNGTYYSAPRTATISVNEHNFNGSELQAAIVATLQSQGISVPGVNGWSTSGDIHTATIYFGADGDYSFTLDYTDLAGNAAQTYVQSQFTVDQTKPVVEIFDIIHKSANNGVVAPGVRYSDVNADIDGVSITIHGSKHSTVNVDGERTSIPNGQSIKMADFEHVQSVDDVYTLTATVTDMAGNIEEQSVTFSVNRFGSTYVFGENTEAFVERYYNNKEQDVVITEINVDTLVEGEVSYGRDGNLVKLEKGTDYTVKESGTEVSWKSYEYTIKADNFEEEGHYDLTLASEDRATNIMNNKVKELNVEFVIDKTAPTVVITGVEDGGQYRANQRDISIAVSDNVEIGTLDIYVDGERQTAEPVSAEQIRENKGQVPFSIGASNNWQNVKAVAVDAAGNRAETPEANVLVTSNIFYQIIRNTPVLIGLIILLILAAAIVYYFLILGKRRKKEEK